MNISMALEVKAKAKEPFEVFLRRTKRAWLKSGQILQARKVKFQQAKKSKNVRKKLRVKSNKIRKKNDYLRKVGKLKEDKRGRGRGRRR